MPSLSCVEPARLMRGAVLPIRRVGPAQYVVAGSRAPWFVDLNTDPPCSCEDLYFKGERIGHCKHIWAARLQERDPVAVNALALMLATIARYTEQFTERAA